MKGQIEQAIKKALAELGAGEASFVVGRPRALNHGDYATNAALVAKVDPEELHGKLRNSLSSDDVERIEVAGKFINFFLSRKALIPQPQEIPQLYAGKRVMVEYTQPNPFKPFHIGHLMSNTLGEALARVFEAAGARVLRANYQGDVGPHVAKALYALMQKGLKEPTIQQIGEAYVEGNRQYEESPEAKAAIDSLNKKIYERSDAAINALYEHGRALSLAHFEEIYKTLGTKFDHYFFESETGPVGVEIVQKHPDIFVESEGALVYHGEHTRVFVTSQGLPTYEAKELGLAELKKQKADFDESVTVTANEQDAYFRVVFDALVKLRPEWAGRFVHTSHGMMRFAEGKMSSRRGNVITGESLINDMVAGAKEKMQDREIRDADRVAEQVAVGAIKYAVLKQGSGRDIVFDPEKSLSLEGDSGPYLQYARVRALSLLEKAKEAGIEADLQDAPAEVTTLERVLVHFPEAVERAARELEPHYMTTYLTELAGEFNSWYAGTKVIGGANPRYGVFLVKAFEKVVSEGLRALGIPAPREM